MFMCLFLAGVAQNSQRDLGAIGPYVFQGDTELPRTIIKKKQVGVKFGPRNKLPRA